MVSKVALLLSLSLTIIPPNKSEKMVSEFDVQKECNLSVIKVLQNKIHEVGDDAARQFLFKRIRERLNLGNSPITEKNVEDYVMLIINECIECVERDPDNSADFCAKM